MKLKAADLLFYAVTDRRWCRSQTLPEAVVAALRGGITCLQYREKEQDFLTCLDEGRQLLELCHRFEVPFIVNDSVVLAQAIGADGVHLGADDGSIHSARQSLGPDRIIGATARTAAAALAAERAGADYIGSGAVFGSRTKSDAKPLSPAELQAISRVLSIPLVAIGGIAADNIHQLSGLGLAGVAVVSAVFSARDIERHCREFKTLISRSLSAPTQNV